MTSTLHRWQPSDSGFSDTWAEVCILCGAELTYTVDQDGETTVRYVPPENRPACSEAEDENGNEAVEGGNNP